MSASAARVFGALAAPARRRRAGICAVCGCTDRVGCPEGCHWLTSTLCSACAETALAALEVIRADADPGHVTGPALRLLRRMLEERH